MTGMCGFIGLQPPGEISSELVVTKMAQSLDTNDVSEITTATGEDWGIAVVAPWGNYLTADAEYAAALSGTPDFNTPELAKDERAHGGGPAILRGHRRLGDGVLDHISGPFSLVILDIVKRKALIATDRAAICPLYYAFVENGIVFSSHLNSFVDNPFLTLDVDPQAIYNYLYFHVIPAPRTIYKQVMRLDPGTCIKFENGNTSISSYWHLKYSDEKLNRSVADYKDEFRSLIGDSVKRELKHGDRLSCFLSGGTDSSTLAGYLGEVTGEPARTYSIGFDAKGYDETHYAHIAAEHFQTDHHEYFVTPDDIVNLVPKIIGVYGQPFGNSSVIPAYYCAKLARADGNDRIMGGDGGDELFGGNERYAKQKLFSWYDKIPKGVQRNLIEPTLEKFPARDAIWPIRKAWRYVEQAREPMPDRMESYNFIHWFGANNIFEPDFLTSIDQATPLNERRRTYNAPEANTMLNRMLALDYKYTLADNDLPKVTGMCDLADINAAYPFMSDALVEFSTRLPIDLKLKGFKLRYFYKEALRDFLPEEIIHKKKHGFGLPVGPWMQAPGKFRELAFDSLESLKSRNIIRADFIDEIRNKWLQETPGFYGGLIWVMMILEDFQQTIHEKPLLSR